MNQWLCGGIVCRKETGNHTKLPPSVGGRSHQHTNSLVQISTTFKAILKPAATKDHTTTCLPKDNQGGSPRPQVESACIMSDGTRYPPQLRPSRPSCRCGQHRNHGSKCMKHLCDCFRTGHTCWINCRCQCQEVVPAKTQRDRYEYSRVFSSH